MSGWNQRPIGQTFYQEEPSRRHQEMNSGNYTSTRIRSHERAVTRIWDKTSNFQESRNNKIENQIFITGILLWNLLFLPSCSLTFYFPKDMPRYVTNQEVYGRLVNLGIERDVVSCLMKLLRKIQTYDRYLHQSLLPSDGILTLWEEIITHPITHQKEFPL